MPSSAQPRVGQPRGRLAPASARGGVAAAAGPGAETDTDSDTDTESGTQSAARSLAVAVSGGLDSTALLHATARLATPLGLTVHALHVHHGLQPEADAWMHGVAAQCRRWARSGLAVRFHGQRLQGAPARGESVEAWARRERYRALSALAQGAGCALVLLAQHRRDQAETVLLQALRGAGPAGLAAMPAAFERNGILWLRPWLDQPRAAIEAYQRRWQLRAVSDPSNSDPRFARSRLRTAVWPALHAAFPEAEQALTAVARQAAQARALADEVAAADLAPLCAGPALLRAGWLQLSSARRSAALRRWLSTALAPGWPDTLLQRLLHELPACTVARWPAGAQELRLYRGRLQVHPLLQQQPHRPQQRQNAPPRPAQAWPQGPVLDLSQPGDYALAPWPGLLRVVRLDGAAAGCGAAAAPGGLPAALLRHCELRPRRGGEQFQAHAAGLPRALKKQYQERGVPAWARVGPLLFAQGQLLFVPGLGEDARALALPGAPRVSLFWLP